MSLDSKQLEGLLHEAEGAALDFKSSQYPFDNATEEEKSDYKLGGYKVLKKWLPYRERGVPDRPLRPEEVQHFTDTARRIAAILNW